MAVTAETQLLASKTLIRHLIRRCQDCADFDYYCGYGTRTRELLVTAAAQLLGKPEAEIKAMFREIKHDREPDVVVFRRKIEELERSKSCEGVGLDDWILK